MLKSGLYKIRIILPKNQRMIISIDEINNPVTNCITLKKIPKTVKIICP